MKLFLILMVFDCLFVFSDIYSHCFWIGVLCWGVELEFFYLLEISVIVISGV